MPGIDLLSLSCKFILRCLFCNNRGEPSTYFPFASLHHVKLCQFRALETHNRRKGVLFPGSGEGTQQALPCIVVSSTHQPAVYPSTHLGQVRNGVTPAGHLPVNSLRQHSREQVSCKSWRPDPHQLTLAWHLPQRRQCSEPWLCPPERSGSAVGDRLISSEHHLPQRRGVAAPWVRDSSTLWSSFHCLPASPSLCQPPVNSSLYIKLFLFSLLCGFCLPGGP